MFKAELATAVGQTVYITTISTSSCISQHGQNALDLNVCLIKEVLTSKRKENAFKKVGKLQVLSKNIT